MCNHFCKALFSWGVQYDTFVKGRLCWRKAYPQPCRAGVVKNVEMVQLPLHLTVISTVSGQPTIGKPLIGQAREALINSQNRISYVFLSNTASSVSLNSSLFASTDSLH